MRKRMTIACLTNGTVNTLLYARFCFVNHKYYMYNRVNCIVIYNY